MSLSFSQNNEDQIIIDWFGSYVGTFIEAGINDGIVFSNTYALALMGWSGIGVEPSPEAFKRAKFNYRDMPKVKLYNYAATGRHEGPIEFFESGTHLKQNDVALLSTVNKKELERWKGTDNTFEKTLVKARPIKSIIEDSGFDTIDFLSLDLEGSECEVLEQIDLAKYKTQAVCIEWNLNEKILTFIKGYCKQFGLTKELLKNSENIILAK